MNRSYMSHLAERLLPRAPRGAKIKIFNAEPGKIGHIVFRFCGLSEHAEAFADWVIWEDENIHRVLIGRPDMGYQRVIVQVRVPLPSEPLF